MKSLLKQSLYYAAGLFLMKGLSFFMLPITAHFLSTSEFGSLDILLSFLNIGSIIIGFGLVEALYRYIGDTTCQSKRNRVISSAYVGQALLALVILAIGLICLFTLTLLKPNTPFTNSLLVLGTLVVSSFINIPLSWLRLTDNAKSFFWLTTSKALVQATLTYGALTLGLGVTGILLSSFLSSCVLAIALFYIQFSVLPLKFSLKDARRLFRYGWPLVLSGIALFISAGAERWILVATVGTGVLAHYAIAMQFAMMIVFLSEPFTHWWYPKRFAILGEPEGHHKTAYHAEFACHLSLFLAATISLLAPYVITLLFPERYAQASELVPLLCVGMALKQCSHQLNTGCYIGNRPTIVLHLNMAMAAIALILYFTGSVALGLYGVVVAFVALNGIRCALFIFVSQRRLRLPYNYRLIAMHFSWLVAVSLLPKSSLAMNFVLALFSIWALTLHILKAHYLKNGQERFSVYGKGIRS